jgi:serine protease Do
LVRAHPRAFGFIAVAFALVIAGSTMVLSSFDGGAPSSGTQLATAALPPLTPPRSAKPPQKIDAALERALEARLGPSVVNISRASAATGPAHDGDDTPGPEASVGTGVIVHPSGLIATNAHVVFAEHADDAFVVVTHDGTVLDADFVGWDVLADLALLRVKTALPLTAVHFAAADRARVSDQLLAISRPAGADVATDIVSLHALDAEEGLYDDYLRTESLGHGGTTGGPLVDADGEVVGIVTTARSPKGGLAVPAATAQRVIEQLMRYGKPRRGWIGLSTRSVTDDLAQSAGLDQARGALVVGTIDRGPAQAAGLRPGDIVLSLDGREVTGQRLPRVVSEMPLGTKVKVAVWRDRRTEALDIEAREADYFEGRPSPDAADPLSAVGLTLAGLTAELKRKFSLADDADGVVVVDVAGESQAAERELRPGDVIVEAGRQKVTTPAEVARKIDDARKDGLKGILLLVEHDGDLRFVPIRFGRG